MVHYFMYFNFLSDSYIPFGRQHGYDPAMAASRDDKAELARQAWRLMFDYVVETSPDRTRSLAQRGLTPNDARALWGLDEVQGRPIGSLAREWECDPSNATFIVDRLERAGLAERRESPIDRRIKLVQLTPAGATVRRELQEEYWRPPASLLALSSVELESLAAALGKLAPPRSR
jgi:DNA-binding MarR family transcriptional regulator